jgi:hypothetical protein
MGCKKDAYPCYCTKYDFYTKLGACSLTCGEDADLEVSEWRNIFCQAGAGAPAYTPMVDPLAVPTQAPNGASGEVGGACTDPIICPMPIPVKPSPVVPKPTTPSLPKGQSPVKGQGNVKGPVAPKGQRLKGPYVDFEN